jgi:hypothetical protein
MQMKLTEIKELTFELFGMMVTKQDTNETIVLTNGLLKQELDIKSKYFLNRFAKSVSELLPGENDETNEEIWNTEQDISSLILNLPKDLKDKVGEVKTKETYPILMKVLWES